MAKWEWMDGWVRILILKRERGESLGCCNYSQVIHQHTSSGIYLEADTDNLWMPSINSSILPTAADPKINTP
jgi:hypothetical protein